MSNRSTDRKIFLGTIGKPFGIKGFVYFKYFGDDPKSLEKFDHLLVGKSYSKIKLNTILFLAKRIVLLFEGVTNRDKAETYRNKKIYVLEGQLPKLESNRYYWYQLEGLTIENEEGNILGVVKNLMKTGANDVLVVKSSSDSIDERERLIPYVKDLVVKKIDMSEKKILVNWKDSY